MWLSTARFGGGVCSANNWSVTVLTQSIHTPSVGSMKVGCNGPHEKDAYSVNNSL